jgi:hypothetical protein
MQVNSLLLLVEISWVKIQHIFCVFRAAANYIETPKKKTRIDSDKIFEETYCSYTIHKTHG